MWAGKQVGIFEQGKRDLVSVEIALQFPACLFVSEPGNGIFYASLFAAQFSSILISY